MEIIVRVIGYIVLIAIDVGCYLFFHSHFLFVTLMLLAIAPVISVTAAAVLRSKLSVELNGAVSLANQEGFKQGEEMLVRIKIKNPTFLTCLDCKLELTIENEFFETKGEQTISVPVRAFKGFLLDIPIVSEYSGIVSIEVKRVLIKDFIGICFLKKKINKKSEFMVLPNIKTQMEINRNIVSAGTTENEESTKKGSDYSEVSDIREYIQGDVLNNIHWKLTAKKDELMVKDRTSMTDEKIVVFLELYNPSYMIFDNAISTAYSLVHKLVDEKMSVEFMYFSKKGYDFKRYKIDYHAQADEAFSKMFFEKTYDRPDEGASNMRSIHPEILRYIHVAASMGGVNVVVKENV